MWRGGEPIRRAATNDGTCSSAPERGEGNTSIDLPDSSNCFLGEVGIVSWVFYCLKSAPFTVQKYEVKRRVSYDVVYIFLNWYWWVSGYVFHSLSMIRYYKRTVIFPEGSLFSLYTAHLNFPYNRSRDTLRNYACVLARRFYSWMRPLLPWTQTRTDNFKYVIRRHARI